MNCYDQALMAAPHPRKQSYCCVCGDRPTESHHLVRRSRGGHTGPCMSLCVTCHMEAHQNKLHFRHAERWEFHQHPFPIKFENLPAEGWRALMLEEE